MLRVGDVHSMTHLGDEEQEPHCELCEMVIVSEQFNPFTDNNANETGITNPDFSEVNIRTIGYEAPLQFIASPSFVYNKPPPGL